MDKTKLKELSALLSEFANRSGNEAVSAEAQPVLDRVEAEINEAPSANEGTEAPE